MARSSVTGADTMPPGPPVPKPIAAAAFVLRPHQVMVAMRRWYGDAFTIALPIFGRSVVVCSPDLVKQVFQAPPDVLAFGERSPLGDVLGPGSLFAMDGDEHLRERRLILPAFHGERMKGYEGIIEQEARREMATWPVGQEFETLGSFMRITLGAILRTVFGAEGADIDALARVLPEFVTLGSKLSLLTPLRRDLGPLSPGGRFRALRARYDAIIERMIDSRLADGGLEQRDDVMSLLMRAHYDDGSSMSRSAIADALLTLLAAGHETTATSLAWAVERLRRHPWIVHRLVAEAVESESNTLRVATIYELQRTRPVITATGRHALQDFELGDWVIPQNHHVIVAAALIHNDPRFFERPRQFEPDRFIDRKPDSYTWIPFGGGTRRCPGAAFAHMEMDVVLRTLLREFELEPTIEPDEGWRNRGIAYAPNRGGRAIVRRRRATPDAIPPNRAPAASYAGAR
ncbi:MAG TPA: cytochrome P450 [Solirubrobacteraceae bacterium]|nr:cytochrome P450 [Solirubrobacteraceae bacterium]